jgi:hypothetical protein
LPVAHQGHEEGNTTVKLISLPRTLLEWAASMAAIAIFTVRSLQLTKCTALYQQVRPLRTHT